VFLNYVLNDRGDLGRQYESKSPTKIGSEMFLYNITED
jgi:hypothetical protein